MTKRKIAIKIDYVSKIPAITVLVAQIKVYHKSKKIFKNEDEKKRVNGYILMGYLIEIHEPARALIEDLKSFMSSSKEIHTDLDLQNLLKDALEYRDALQKVYDGVRRFRAKALQTEGKNGQSRIRNHNKEMARSLRMRVVPINGRAGNGHHASRFFPKVMSGR